MTDSPMAPAGAPKTEGLTLRRVLLALSLLFFSVVAAAFYAFFFTPAPLRLLLYPVLKHQKQAPPPVVGGSLSEGIEIDRLVLGDKDDGLELEGLKFRYTGLYDLFIRRNLHLTEVSLEKLHLKAKDTGTARVSTSVKGSAQPRPPWSPPSNPGAPKITVDQVRVGQVVVDLPGMTAPLRVDRFEAKGIELTSTRLVYGAVQMASNLFDLTVPEGTAPDRPIQGTLKPQHFQSLKAPVPFSGQVHMEPGKPPTAWLEALKGQIRYETLADGSTRITLKDFNPEEIYRDAPPIRGLNLVLSAESGRGLQTEGWQAGPGSFTLEGRQYQVKTAPLWKRTSDSQGLNLEGEAPGGHWVRLYCRADTTGKISSFTGACGYEKGSGSSH